MSEANIITKLGIVGVLVFGGMYLLISGDLALGTFMTYLGAFFGGYLMGEVRCRR